MFYLKIIEEFGESILELACGTGRLTIPIAEKGFEIVGIDISEVSIEQAIENAKNQNCKQPLQF